MEDASPIYVRSIYNTIAKSTSKKGLSIVEQVITGNGLGENQAGIKCPRRFVKVLGLLSYCNISCPREDGSLEETWQIC
jgi:hypothetical protein